tara:strand:- start:2434 stop:2727 length:294 start_codon:yes stop_codon:yes gene_type:complete
MNNTIKLIVMAGGAILLYRWWKNKQTPAITTRPMEIGSGETIASINSQVKSPDDLFDVGKKERLGATKCGEIASGMEFSNDTQEYAWIVACIQNHGG